MYKEIMNDRNLLCEKLVQYIELSTNLLRDNKELKSELSSVNKLNEHLLDKLDLLQDELDAMEEDLNDKELYISELEEENDQLILEKSQHYHIEKKVWEHWQKLKKEGNY